MVKDKAELPFTVNRKNPASLVDQLAGGLRQAIKSGYYKPGDTLPSLKDLALAAGTSMRIPREAIERLKDEGLVDPRRALGCLVAGRTRTRWRGHVLFILADAEGSYYANVFAGVMQSKLIKAGYLFTRATMSARHGNCSSGALDAALAHNVTLAVLFCGSSSKIRSRLSENGIPFVEIGAAQSCPRKSSGFIHFDREAAVGDFVRHCRERNVKKVLQVCFRDEGDIDATAALSAAGIAVRKLIVPAPAGPGRLEAIQRNAIKAFSREIAGGRGPKEDVVLFTDDFLATGALTAMGRAGLRSPEDVRVVSFANAGFGPVYPVPLTRFEMNPAAHGEAASRLLLDVLAGKPMTEHAAISSVYKKGKTF